MAFRELNVLPRFKLSQSLESPFSSPVPQNLHRPVKASSTHQRREAWMCSWELRAPKPPSPAPTGAQMRWIPPSYRVPRERGAGNGSTGYVASNAGFVSIFRGPGAATACELRHQQCPWASFYTTSGESEEECHSIIQLLTAKCSFTSTPRTSNQWEI